MKSFLISLFVLETNSCNFLTDLSAQQAVAVLGLALIATAVTCLGALLLAICRRWSPQPLVQQLSFLAGMGYAIPGSVLALGLILLGGPLGLALCGGACSVPKRSCPWVGWLRSGKFGFPLAALVCR